MINPWVIAAMIPAMVIVMIHFAIGPFGHPTRLHWHMRWKQWPAAIKTPLLLIASILLTAGASHAVGLWMWPLAE
ncbi:MAG: hypothetical protein CMI13_00980 [Oleibacter sp.]|nr:hypothetical protein [Thalassolituus sp.]|tara:strand:- start:3200 stop:3424 length:225 start_codon:yes stop_codon:yes gene_type:complete